MSWENEQRQEIVDWTKREIKRHQHKIRLMDLGLTHGTKPKAYRDALYRHHQRAIEKAQEFLASECVA